MVFACTARSNLAAGGGGANLGPTRNVEIVWIAGNAITIEGTDPFNVDGGLIEADLLER